MNPKRTMSQALHTGNLSAAAAAFVAAGAAGSPVAPAPAPGPSQDLRARIPAGAMPVAAPEARELAVVPSPLPAERRAPVSMTFRLPAELPSALLRVAMERKLHGERPCTQQDIVAQAMREWLECNVTSRWFSLCLSQECMPRGKVEGRLHGTILQSRKPSSKPRGQLPDRRRSALRVRFPLLDLLMNPGVGRVRDLAEHQQVVAPERVGALPLVVVFVLVEPAERDVVAHAAGGVVFPDGRFDGAHPDLM